MRQRHAGALRRSSNQMKVFKRCLRRRPRRSAKVKFKCESVSPRRLSGVFFKITPYPPGLLYHSGVGFVKRKLRRGYAKISEALRTPAKIFAFFARFCHEVGQFRVAAPGIPACLFSTMP